MKLAQDAEGLALSCFKYFKDGDPMSSLAKHILSAECFSYAHMGHLLLQFVTIAPSYFSCIPLRRNWFVHESSCT